MLEARSLTKVYQGAPALDALDLTVPGGEVFCLLGPNGAGKTTTVNLFLNFVSPTSGSARVCGIDSNEQPLLARRQLAYIPEMVNLYGALSGLENLDFFSALGGASRSTGQLMELLLKAGLGEDAARRPVSGYSKGMRQKVGIAIALAREARALLLDEPTSGLDPLAADEFAGLVAMLRGQGVAILMVTHDLFLAKQCATRIGIMQRGRMVSQLRADEVDHAGLQAVYLETSRRVAA